VVVENRYYSRAETVQLLQVGRQSARFKRLARRREWSSPVLRVLSWVVARQHPITTRSTHAAIPHDKTRFFPQ